MNPDELLSRAAIVLNNASEGSSVFQKPQKAREIIGKAMTDLSSAASYTNTHRVYFTNSENESVTIPEHGRRLILIVYRDGTHYN